MEEIASICAEVIECNVAVFTQKTIHNDHWNKQYKEWFYFAAYFFSNKEKNEILQFSATKAKDLFEYAKSRVRYDLERKKKKASTIIRLITRMLELVPNRLQDIIAIDTLNLKPFENRLPQHPTLPLLEASELSSKLIPGCLVVAYDDLKEAIGYISYDDFPPGTSYGRYQGRSGNMKALITVLQSKGYRFLLIPKKFNFSELKGTFISKPYEKALNQYQVSKIPIRSLEWMANNNTERFLTVYRVGDPNFCGTFHKQWPQDREPLLKSQEEGYRYLDQSPHKDDESEEHFKLFNPICDKCQNKSSCESKDKKASEKENCYKPVTTDPLRVPAELLEELLIHQLQ